MPDSSIYEDRPRERLTRSEEESLGKRSETDYRARNTLVEHNVGLVLSYANSLVNRGVRLSFEDLVQYGLIGLMRAGEKYNPDKNAKFSTYGLRRAKADMLRAITNHSRTIRVPAHLNVAMNHSRKKLADLSTEDKIKKLVKKDPKRKGEHLGHAIEADRPNLPFNEEVFHLIPTDRLKIVDPEKEAMHRVLVELVRDMIDRLPEKHANVIRTVYGLGGNAPVEYTEMGKRLGITRQGVKEIERRAFSRIRREGRAEHLRGFAIS